MVTQESIEVQVTRLKIRLVRIDFPGGHHIVIGGRLVSSSKDGKTVPHPDLPEYTEDMFPVGAGAWAYGEHPDVRVSMVTKHGRRQLGYVRACTLMFTPRSRDTVSDWIRSQS